MADLDPYTDSTLIAQELTQRREEGCTTESLEGALASAMERSDAAEVASLVEELVALEPAADFPYEEPSALEAIQASRPEGPRKLAIDLSRQEMLDRIYGGWLGRAAGCALGKPVEGWDKARIDSYLSHTDALPLDNYIPHVTDHPDGIVLNMRDCTLGNIEYMARDDDMDYPILGLVLMESKGLDFEPRNMANTWLARMPYYYLYTAERVAYRNFVNGLWPPESASYRNPYREWIGAQIRADIFGYVAPGQPELAAALAFRDASISHVKNGIYGEMFVAAMLAAAYTTDDVHRIIEIGLSEIPAKCRLAEAVHDTIAWCEADDWETAWSRIDDKYGHYSRVHTINNAALVVMGLLYGANDYETGIVVSVRGGWDTDCNGATVGSILGLKDGARSLPDKWVGPLGDRLLSVVRDSADNRMSDLAARTLQVIDKVAD